MTLTQASLRYPVTVAMAVLAALVLGFLAAVRMPVSLLPDIKLPLLTLTTVYEGASASEIEAQVTKVLEEGLGATPGLEQIEGVSLRGRSILRLRFAFGRDTQQASLDVRDRLDLVRNLLPQDARRTTVSSGDPAGVPVCVYFADPVGVPLPRLRAFLEDNLKNELERVPGVARVVLKGGREQEILVEASPHSLYARKLSLVELKEKIMGANVSSPAGSLEEGRFSVLVKTAGEFRRRADLEDLVIAHGEGKGVVLLSELARVRECAREPKSVVLMDGREGMSVEIHKESGANTVRVCAAVAEVVESLKRRGGAAIPYRLTPIRDDSQAIRRTIFHLALDGVLGILAALIVLVLFLREPIFPALVGLALPASLFAAAVGLYFAGSGFNVMTLGGLAVASGLVLDNAIVVLDAILEKRRGGQSWSQAALTGCRRVGLSVWASTLTVLVVFLPLVFVQGILGEFFKDLSRAVIFALAASIAVSLSLLPVLVTRGRVGKLLDLGVESGKFGKRWQQISEASKRAWEKWVSRYQRALQWTLSHRRVLLFTYPVVVVVSLAFFAFGLKRELVPRAASRTILVALALPPGTVLSNTTAAAADLAKRTGARPGVEKTLIRAGLDPSENGENVERKGSHWAEISVFLGRHRRENERVFQWLLARAKRGGEVGGKFEVAYEKDASVSWLGTSTGASLELLAPDELAGARGLAWLEKRVTEVNAARLPDTPGKWVLSREGASETSCVRLVPDREAALRCGYSARELGEELRASLAGVEAGFLHLPNREVPIRVAMEGAQTAGLSALPYLKGRDKPAVAVSLVLRSMATQESVALRRQNGCRAVRLWLTGSGTSRPDEAAKATESLVREASSRLEQETGCSLLHPGSTGMDEKEFRPFVYAFVLSILFIYMLLAAQLASLSAPLYIMSGIPLIFAGVDLALTATGQTVNLFSGLGIILLSGAVVREGVLLWERSREGTGGVVEAALSRLRPILATALTSILALLPLALGLGEGVEIQSSLAIAMIGGLTASTLLTLFYLPALLASKPAALCP